MLPDGGKGARAMAASPSTTRMRRAPTAGAAGTGAAHRAEGSAASGLADACRHRCVPDGWRAPKEARAIGWEQDVDLDGNPPSVPALRADRAAGDTKTPPSRRALKLALMAVGALMEWQADQAAEREAARSQWQDTGRVFTTATGTPLGARHVRKMFQDVCERAGFGTDWAPRDLRHTLVSLLSDDGMAIEKIARLAGHASSHVTETVYRQELRPVLQEGAEVMDRLFGSVNGDPAERMTPKTTTEYGAL
jgi:integrase